MSTSSVSATSQNNSFESYPPNQSPSVKSAAVKPMFQSTAADMQTNTESKPETQTKTEQVSNKTLTQSKVFTGRKIDECEEKVIHSIESLEIEPETIDDDLDTPLPIIIKCRDSKYIKYVYKCQEFIKLIQYAQAKYPGMIDVTIDETNLSLYFYHGVDEMKALFSIPIFNKIELPFSELAPEAAANEITSMGGPMKVSEETRNNFQMRKSKLLEKAEAFLDQSAGKKKIHVHKTVADVSIKNFVKELFKTSQGVCIGESHNQTCAKEWIISHLRDLDVKTVYIEHLHYDTLQRLLDEYFASSEKEPNLLLDGYLKTLDEGWLFFTVKPGTYRNLVIAVKQAGARVVGLDTTIVSRSGMNRKTGTENVAERCKAFSYMASKIIKREQQRLPGRYIALMGDYHTCSSNGDGVLGISELMGASCMTILNNEERKPVITYYTSNVPEEEPRRLARRRCNIS